MDRIDLFIEKDNQNPDTIINLIVVYQHQGKVELAQRQIKLFFMNLNITFLQPAKSTCTEASLVGFIAAS